MKSYDEMTFEEKIEVVRLAHRFFEDSSRATHVDAQVYKLLAAILDAKDYSDWLHDHDMHPPGVDARAESVDLLWSIVNSFDAGKLEAAMTKAKKCGGQLEEYRDVYFD
ncbi:MAG: hypothetical protein AABO58_00820 [Acidobacteriota bacterium]